MTIYLTKDEVRRLLTEAINQALDQYLGSAVVPVPDDEPIPDSSDNDNELPPLAPAPAELTLSIPSIPFFPKAVEDALDSSVADNVDNALQFDVPVFASAGPSEASGWLVLVNELGWGWVSVRCSHLFSLK
jgi:hypothetical protein